MSKIITRLFTEFSDAERAVEALESVGVPHNDISLVSRDADDERTGFKTRKPHDHTAGEAAAVDAGAGAAAGGLAGAAGGVLAGLGLLAVPGLGPVIAAGWLASAVAGAIAGGAVLGAAGGIVGALTNAGVSKEEADLYAESVRRGDTLVSAKVDDSRVASAQSALSAIPSVDLAAREVAYRESGWRGFDESAGPLTEEKTAAERLRYADR